MENEKQVNPLSSGTEEVSSNIEDGVVEAPATSSPEGTPASVAMINCSECGTPTPKIGRTRYCKTCAKERERRRVIAIRTGNKAETYVYNAKEEPTKADAKRLIEERGIRHPHVINIVYKLLTREAEERQISPNRFLYANGLKAALAAYEQKAAQPLEAIADEYVPGELLTKAELFAEYDASIATHEEITFEEFLSTRLRCKSDTFYLGKEVFKNDFAHVHEVWRDFFPRWNPLTLPPNYTQKQAIEWLASQSDVKDFLLMASRRAFKSSFARLWLASLIITLPDSRILIVSETRDFAKDNIIALRAIFEAAPGFETRFNRLFPEFTIPVGDGSAMTLDVPTRRLKLPQIIESSSFGTGVSGRRADVILFDDPISQKSCTDEVQIAKSVSTRDLICKLKERGGLVVTLGTPYAAQDLYKVQITRAERNKDATFASRVDPAFTVKTTAGYKLTPALAPTITLDDIDSFLFPEGLPWGELRVDLLNNPNFFLSQNLCIFPEEEDSDIKCQFDHNMLWRRVRTMTELGNAKGAVNFMSLDRGWSDTRFADFSCAVVGRVQPVDGRQALVVVDAKLERARESEVIKDMLVPLIALHKPRVLIFEEDRGWKDFEESLRRALVLRNIIVPWLRHVPIDTSPRSKSIRVKALELPIHSGRMYFNAAIPDLEICLGQLERFDGTTNSNSHRKDDFPDSLAILADACLPKTHEEVAKEDPKEAQQRKDREEVEFERERRQAYHDRMHGGPSQPEQEQPPPQTPAPVYRPPTAMGNGFATLPGNMRGNPNKR